MRLARGLVFGFVWAFFMLGVFNIHISNHPVWFLLSLLPAMMLFQFIEAIFFAAPDQLKDPRVKNDGGDEPDKW